MSTEIYTPTAEQLDARIARFDQLTPMSTTDDLAWVQNQIAKHNIAAQVMAHTHRHADKARMALETLPSSPYRDALDTLLRLILNRTY